MRAALHNCAGPCADKATSEQNDHDGESAGNSCEGSRRRAERQSGIKDDEADGFVQDTACAREPKRADQQRQSKFPTAQTDQAAKRADNRAAAEG